jgi:glutamine synthetase
MHTFLEQVEAFRDQMESYVRDHGDPSGLSLSDPKDVLKYCEEQGITSLRLRFTDILGFLKSFALTPAELVKETLGEEVVTKLIETKLADYERFRLYISPLDLERHMEL